MFPLVPGPGHVTFWYISNGAAAVPVQSASDQQGLQPALEEHHQLRATEGCFLMTDVADVETVVIPANNNKVISSCHWGNILIWEDGVIQMEIARKDGSACHEGTVNHMIAEEGELITIGTLKGKLWQGQKNPISSSHLRGP